MMVKCPEQVPGINEGMKQGVMLRGEQGFVRGDRCVLTLDQPVGRGHSETSPSALPQLGGEGKAGGGAAGPEG